MTTFTTVTASADDRVAVTLAGTALTIDIWSGRGIGRATVARTGGPAPSAITLRLHLGGLEELRVSYGQASHVVAVASGPGHPVTQSLVTPGRAAEPLAPDDPRQLAVQIVAAAPDPPFPLRGGHFAVTLPAAALTAGALSLSWVDFFR